MKTIKCLLIVVGLFLCTTVLNAQAKDRNREVAGKAVKTVVWGGKQVQIVEREVVIKVSPLITETEIEKLISLAEGKILCPFDKLGVGVIQLSKGKDEITSIKNLKNAKHVVFAEPNMVGTAFVEPNDDYYQGTTPATYAHQWALKNTGQSPPTGTSDADIDANEAWNITTGNDDVIIAILDSGIPIQSGSLSHPDLDDPNKIILGSDFTGDGDGVKDRYGHGTHVAGIAAAESNNDEGIAGIAWNCKILVIQVFNYAGTFEWIDLYSGVVDAVDYQRNHPGKKVVINFSGGDFGTPPQVAEDAVQYANLYNVPLICSAGNHAIGDPYPVAYPAAFSEDYINVFAVSSTDATDTVSPFSCQGPEITISAPGGYYKEEIGGVNYYNSVSMRGKNIFSTTPNYPFNFQIGTDLTTNYGYMCGTSMAAPQVAGVAALVLSVNPDLLGWQVRNIIKQTADDKGTPGFDNFYGYGRINAYQALKYTLEVYGGTLTQDLTIPAGESWVLCPDVTLTFENNASLIVNGTLDVEGSESNPVVIDFVSPNSGTQNGIKFNSGSSGSIDYCQIRNAYRGVYENNTSVDITNTAISNCRDGIYLYSSSPDIEDCNIHDNSNSGITLLYSSPDISNGNYIDDNTYGVYSSSYSHPIIGDSPNGNLIRDNNYGVFCLNYGTPKIGDPSGNGGYNNMLNSAYNVFNTTGMTVYARNNWWGTTTPGNFKITGVVNYSPYLASARTISTPPLSKAAAGEMMALGNDIPMLSELDKACQLLAENKLEAARKVCMELINNYPDYSVAGNALLLLQDTFAEEDKAAAKDVYASLFNNKSKKNLYAMAGLMLANMETEGRLEKLDQVIERYDGENIVELALFDKFVYYQFEMNDAEKAMSISKELDARDPDSYAAIAAHVMLGNNAYNDKLLERGQLPQTASAMAIPQDFAVYANYPNPFNPETYIRFDVPEADQVTVEIFDVRGRLVNTLANGQYQAGRHSVTWRGTTAAGTQAASGMYFYRIRYRDQMRTHKMLLIK